MTHTAFYGRIETGGGGADAVRQALEEWLGVTGLSIRHKLSGDEMLHEDERFYVYCHAADPAFEGEDMFLLEGTLQGGLEDTRAELERLLKICGGRKLTSDFEYSAVDESGTPRGGMIQVS